MNKGFLLRFFLFFAAAFGAIFLFVWFYLSVTAPANAAEPTPATSEAITFETGQVQIRSRSGRAYSVNVEIATSPEQQSQGLMHRTALAENSGMLFIYRPPRRIAMWMKNTLVPLDMLFASRNGTIFHIAENTEPMNEDLIAPPGVVAYVLEVPAGTAKRLGIHTGDHLVR